MSEVSPLFVMLARGAVKAMRDHGMNETLIACAVTDIRSAALSEERLRLELLASKNPPTHFDFGAIKKAFQE